jgi:hypothetical protein
MAEHTKQYDIKVVDTCIQLMAIICLGVCIKEEDFNQMLRIIPVELKAHINASICAAEACKAGISPDDTEAIKDLVNTLRGLN